jgi:hypothetical protein
MQKVNTGGLLAMGKEELSALLLSNYSDVIKSYKAYTDNFKKALYIK